MKASIWRMSLLLAALALVAISACSTAAVSPSSPAVAWTWGDNLYGQLGNNSTTQSLLPVGVQMPPNVRFTRISGGNRYSLALDTAGHAWAWGENNHGQLEKNTTDESLVPV